MLINQAKKQADGAGDGRDDGKRQQRAESGVKQLIHNNIDTQELVKDSPCTPIARKRKGCIPELMNQTSVPEQTLDDQQATLAHAATNQAPSKPVLHHESTHTPLDTSRSRYLLRYATAIGNETVERAMPIP